MESIDYKKIAIVFERGNDGEYHYKHVTTDEDSVELKEGIAIKLAEEKFASLKNGTETQFSIRDVSGKKYVSLVLTESLYSSLVEMCKAEGHEDEESYTPIIKQLLERIAGDTSFTKLKKFGDLVSFSICRGNKNIDKDNKVDNKKASDDGEKDNDNSSEKKESGIDISALNPIEISGRIKEKVVAQDEAVDSIVNNIYNNQRIVESDNEDLLGSKSCVLLDGPTGTGKTLIIKEVAREMSLPMIVRSATMYSASGYKGKNVEDMLVDLLKETDGNLELAERGIIVLDEFDKLIHTSDSELEMRKAVQQDLLAFFSGTKFPIEYKGKNYEFDTSKISFICLGAFTDLRERKIRDELDENGNYTMKPEDYINEGIMRELVGRFTLLTSTKSLGKEDLIRILKESAISPLIQLKVLAKLEYDVDITYDDEIIDKIAMEALQEDTGARALQTVVNGIRNVILDDMVNKHTTPIEITDELLEKSKEVYIREGGLKK